MAHDFGSCDHFPRALNVPAAAVWPPAFCSERLARASGEAAASCFGWVPSGAFARSQASMAGREEPLFLAFVRDQEKNVVDARKGLDLATLLPSLFSSADVVGLLLSFNNAADADDWVVGPTLPCWRVDLGGHQWGVGAATMRLHGAEASSVQVGPRDGLLPFVAVLTTAGGFLCDKGSDMGVVQLLNTLLVLRGEVVLLSSFHSQNDAMTWLGRPTLSAWLRALCLPSGGAGSIDRDGVMVVSDDSSSGSASVVVTNPVLVRRGVPAAVATYASALPPLLQPGHAMFLRRGLDESSPLRVVVLFSRAVGAVLPAALHTSTRRHDRGAPRVSRAVDSTSYGSLLSSN